jgi:hypothetical protein
VVETVNDEKHAPTGVRVAACLDCDGERFRGSGEPGPQVCGGFGHDLFELPQQTSDDNVGEDALLSVDVGGTEPAVVPGDDPVFVAVGVCELFAQPGLADTGFAGNDDAAAGGGDGVDMRAHFGGSAGPGHDHGRFDWVSFRDGTEVGGEPNLGQHAFPRDVPIECAGAGGCVRQGERRVFGWNAGVGGAASAELFDNATQERALSGTGRGEVERRGRGAGVDRKVLARRADLHFSESGKTRLPGFSFLEGSRVELEPAGDDARQRIAGVIRRVDGFQHGGEVLIRTAVADDDPVRSAGMLVQVGQERAEQQVEPETPPVSGEAVLRELAVQNRVLDLNADSPTGPVADSQVVEPVAREPLGVDRDACGGA